MCSAFAVEYTDPIKGIYVLLYCCTVNRKYHAAPARQHEPRIIRTTQINNIYVLKYLDGEVGIGGVSDMCNHVVVSVAAARSVAFGQSRDSKLRISRDTYTLAAPSRALP